MFFPVDLMFLWRVGCGALHCPAEICILHLLSEYMPLLLSFLISLSHTHLVQPVTQLLISLFLWFCVYLVACMTELDII